MISGGGNFRTIALAKVALKSYEIIKSYENTSLHMKLQHWEVLHRVKNSKSIYCVKNISHQRYLDQYYCCR